MPKNWLVTGGCGFIGVNLIDYLRRHRPETNIRILDNLSVGSRDDLREVAPFQEVSDTELGSHPSGVELMVGDIQDYDACFKACQGVGVVIHLAANTGVGPSVEDPRKDMEANVLGLFNVLESSRQHKVNKFIFASSGAPVGEVNPPIHEEIAPKPVSPYGASKLAGEGYCSAYFRTFGLKTVALRFGNVYGPRSKHKSSVVAKFFKQALVGEPLEIFGDGTQTRDFIYIDDLVKAITLAVVSDTGGEIFQIATYKESTVNEVAKMISDIVKKTTGKNVKIIHGATRKGDVKRNYSDISKAKNNLGYEPLYDLATGLQETYGYFNPNRGNTKRPKQ
jgi:UDP-glucose 4-epimerase